MSVRAPEMQLETRPSRRDGCADTVVVLGGGGFVGSAISGALVRAGFAPVCVQRTGKPAPACVRQVICDATRPDDIRRALQGADWVVNAIAGDSQTMLAATRAMVLGADGKCRIVHVSSMAVYGDKHGYVDEAAPLHAATRYGATKITCEHMLAGTGATILRPGIVYGPGSLQWVGRIGRLLRAGRLGDLGKHGDGRCNLVFSQDLGAAVVAAIGQTQARGRAINLGVTAPPRWNDFLVSLGCAIGAVPVARIPAWRLALEVTLLAPPLHLAGRAANRAWVPEAISPALKAIFGQDIVLDTGLADRLLGIRHTPLADG